MIYQIDLENISISVGDKETCFSFHVNWNNRYNLYLDNITGERRYTRENWSNYEIVIKESTYINHAKNCDMLFNYTPQLPRLKICPIPYTSIINFVE